MNKEALILVVEDDSAVRNVIRAALKTHRYRWTGAVNGEQAVARTALEDPDVILLDLGLPDMDGTDVIKRIRSWSCVPIIVVSARGDDTDKIAALDAGADDYLTKPFSVEELMARLRVTLRRLNAVNAESVQSEYSNGPLTINYAAGVAYMEDLPLRLTPIEYKLLCLFARNTGRVLTHSYITEQIWGSNLESDTASLRVFMATLRKKLGSDPAAARLIHTHVGVGYSMEQE